MKNSSSSVIFCLVTARGTGPADSVGPMPGTSNLPSLELEPHGPDTFVGSSPDYPWGRIYGGLVVAQALTAATSTVDPDHHVHSLHAYFILGGVPTEPVRYEVDRIRNGRSFSTRRVVARQSSGAILNLSASYHRIEDGPEVVGVEMPAAPAPDEMRPSQWESGFDYREVDPPPEVGRSWAWARYQAPLPDDSRAHACALAFLSDANPMDSIAGRHPVTPTSPEEWGETFVSASLDHAVWFHHPVRADEWLLFDMHSSWVGGSRGIGRGEVFQGGRLVATVAQEGLLRLRSR
jgi:acyl-CoA thioesterase-2